MFPIINNINDVLPHIVNKPEIIVVEKEGFTVLNYVISNETTFDNPYARECRGIKFCNKTGNILSRPYHKFFNINQVAETHEQIINQKLNDNHIILEKLDGSMIAPIMLNDNVRFCTKMGITDIAIQAEEFIFGKHNYQDFILNCLERQITPIFEWCSRKQRIVLDYPEDNLILTAMRYNVSGEYYSYDKLCIIAEIWGVPYVSNIAPFFDIKDLKYYTTNLENEEGFVIVWEDGYRAKIKSDWYCLRHSSRDLVTQEYKVIQLILSEEVDDLKPLLVDTDIKQVENLEKIVERLLEWIAISYELKFKYAKHYKTRKEFALSKMAKSLNSESRSAVFSMLDGKTSRELAINSLKKHSSKDGLWNEFKETYKGVFAANSLTWE